MGIRDCQQLTCKKYAKRWMFRVNILMGIPETKIDKELLGIIESFNVTQISNIKKLLALMLEVSKY